MACDNGVLKQKKMPVNKLLYIAYQSEKTN